MGWKNLFQCLKDFVIFHGNGCKEEKNTSSLARIFVDSNYLSENWLDEYKARKKLQKTYFKNKGNLNLHLNFLTNFHKTFTFHDYLLQFYP